MSVHRQTPAPLRRLHPFLLLLLALLLPRTLAAQDAPPPTAPRTLHLVFAGDIMGHDVNYRMADYHDIYHGVQQYIDGADLAVANLELPVDPTRPESGYPEFNGSAAYVRAAVDAGFNVLSTANNHAFDGGTEGILQTLRTLHGLDTSPTRPLMFSGTRGNPRRPFLPESFLVQGVRVGFIAVTQFLNEPDQGRYVDVVDYTDVLAAECFLRFLRDTSRQYDLLIVSYHGDQEYASAASARKSAFFRRMLAAGVHIVFAHHPHVVQPYELVRAEGGGRLIMYSMGNLISAMTWTMDPATADETTAETGEAYLLSVDVRCAAEGCSVQQVSPIPVANYRNARGEMVVGSLSDLAAGSIGLPAVWRSYYARRLEKMRRFLGASDGSAAGPGGGAGDQ
jgi:poly-gamma-glutamate synthesis protein (capsule biosynthesis protein)